MVGKITQKMRDELMARIVGDPSRGLMMNGVTPTSVLVDELSQLPPADKLGGWRVPNLTLAKGDSVSFVTSITMEDRTVLKTHNQGEPTVWRENTCQSLNYDQIKFWNDMAADRDWCELWAHAYTEVKPHDRIQVKVGDGMDSTRVYVVTEITYQPDGAWTKMQDARSWGEEHMADLVHDPEPSLPPHVIDLPVGAGDRVVITHGEQRGWTGVCATDPIAGAITVAMRRPDGSKGPTVAHKVEYVARLADPVPSFGSLSEAEAWLSSMDRKRRQLFATGSVVEFDYYVKAKGFDEKVGFAHARMESVRCTGKVVAFMPFYENQPGYKVLAQILMQDPKIYDVASSQIVGLAPASDQEVTDA